MKKVIKTLALATSLAALSSQAWAKIQIETYNPGDKSIFAVTSSILLGDKEAILIDAQFQKNDAENVVKQIKASGRTLKTVFISHSDPDYYFGLDVIQKNFPDAKIIATPQVAYLIDATKEDKLGVWKGDLGVNAPEKVLTPEATLASSFKLEGTDIEIKQNPQDPDHAYLWIPKLKTVLGGIPVTTGEHIWLADSQKAGALKTWSDKITEIKALKPVKVIPGHSVYTGERLNDPKGLDEVQRYLNHAIAVKEKAKNSADFIQQMKTFYPDLHGESSLEMSAKVLLGEMPWVSLSSYPAIAKKIKVDFGDVSYQLDFKDNKTMSFKGLTPSTQNDHETVSYKAVEVAPQVYMVYWSEPKSGDKVVHIQDFGNKVVYTNIATKDGAFYNLKGSLSFVK